MIVYHYLIVVIKTKHLNISSAELYYCLNYRINSKLCINFILTMAKKTIGIVTQKGIEEVEVEVAGKPKMIVGLAHERNVNDRKERIAILRALKIAGFETYAATNCPWPNDAYLYLDGLYAPQEEFADSNGSLIPQDQVFSEGNYIFGEDFILVSTAIKEDLEKLLKDHKQYRTFFKPEKRRIVYIKPYDATIYNERGDANNLNHIDLTIGYVPERKLLCINSNHYAQVEKEIRTLQKEHGVEVLLTFDEVPNGFHYYPNNFYVIRDYLPDEGNKHKNKKVRNDGLLREGLPINSPLVIANKYNQFYRKLTEHGVQVIVPDLTITKLAVGFGSIKCATNQVDDVKLLDMFGIKYEQWPSHRNHEKREKA